MQFSGMDSALRMALNSGLQEKARPGRDRGHGRAVDRYEPRQSQRLGGDHLRVVSLAVSFQSRRWSVRRTEKRYPGADGLWHLRARGRRLPVPARTSRRCQHSNRIRAACECRRMCQPWASHKQNAVVRRGLRKDMVQPIWSAITIIVDEVTLSGKGEIEVTAVLDMKHQNLRRRDSTSSKVSINRRSDGAGSSRRARVRFCRQGKRTSLTSSGRDDVVISVGRDLQGADPGRGTFPPRTRRRCGWRSICKPRRSETHASGN